MEIIGDKGDARMLAVQYQQALAVKSEMQRKYGDLNLDRKLAEARADYLRRLVEFQSEALEKTIREIHEGEQRVRDHQIIIDEIHMRIGRLREWIAKEIEILEAEEEVF
jgi:hypothetical protein